MWNRPKGNINTICPKCQVTCARCSRELTEETKSKAGSKRNQYYCRFCVAETIRLSTNRERQKDYDLRRNYGITLPEYESMLQHQDGACAICKNPPSNYKLAVDHKHGKAESKEDPMLRRARVRGLLCWHCNAAIGKFKDNPALLRAAAEYLEHPPAQEIIGEVNESKKDD